MSKRKSSFGQPDIVRLSDEEAAVALLERAVTGHLGSRERVDAFSAHYPAKLRCGAKEMSSPAKSILAFRVV